MISVYREKHTQWTSKQDIELCSLTYEWGYQVGKIKPSSCTMKSYFWRQEEVMWLEKSNIYSLNRTYWCINLETEERGIKALIKVILVFTDSFTIEWFISYKPKIFIHSEPLVQSFRCWFTLSKCLGISHHNNLRKICYKLELSKKMSIFLWLNKLTLTFSSNII